MNSEKKAFEEFFFKTNAYKRIQHHIDMCASGYHQELHNVFQLDDFNEDEYANETVQTSWESWQSSAKRQGYKLVPVSELQKYVNSIRHYNNSGDYDRIEYDLTSIENVFTKP